MVWCMSSLSFNMQHQLLSRVSKVFGFCGMFCVLSLAQNQSLSMTIYHTPILLHYSNASKAFERFWDQSISWFFTQIFSRFSKRAGDHNHVLASIRRANIKYFLAIQNRRRVRRSVSRVWLKRHLHTLSICCVFLLLCGFKAFKRFCIWVMSSPLKNSTFTGSKRVLKRAMVLSSTSGLYLYYSTTPYTEVQIGLIYTALLRCKIPGRNHAKYTAFLHRI